MSCPDCKNLLTPWHECPDCQVVENLRIEKRALQRALWIAVAMMIVVALGVSVISASRGYQYGRIKATLDECRAHEVEAP